VIDAVGARLESSRIQRRRLATAAGSSGSSTRGLGNELPRRTAVAWLDEFMGSSVATDDHDREHARWDL